MTELSLFPTMLLLIQAVDPLDSIFFGMVYQLEELQDILEVAEK